MTSKFSTLLIGLTTAVLVQLFLLGYSATVDGSQMHIDKDNLRRTLEIFSKERNDANKAEKERVRQRISTFFLSLGSPFFDALAARLETYGHNYRDEVANVNGTNIILVIKGERYGTSDDEISLVGAHYDSTSTPGVDDNGSGMVALFEIARILSRAMIRRHCTFQNTIIVAAFDHEEIGLIGSEQYAKYLDAQILQKFGVTNFLGAYILETMMNFDATNNSQEVPQGFDQIFQDQYQKLQDNNFRGDFLTTIVRQDDTPLSDLLSEQWYQIVGGDFKSTDKYRQITVPLPKSGNPNDWTSQERAGFKDFFRSDHYSFWTHRSQNNQTGLKAVFITDTADFRGFMRTCYHNTCDDLSKVNDDSLEFLQIGAEAVLRSLTILSTQNATSECLNAAAVKQEFSIIVLIATFCSTVIFF